MLGELVRFPVNISSPNSFIEGNLVIPDNPIGIVVFAHGSGSSKNSKRNQLVSEELNKNNIATLLFDLLSVEEQAFDSQLDKMISKIPGAVLNKFNVSLLAKRLSMATEWVMSNPSTEKLQVSYFASSTGGAAALMTTCRYNIRSIVLKKMKYSKEKKLSIIEGASHLFEEEGTLQLVAEVATLWLTRHFILRATTNSTGK